MEESVTAEAPETEKLHVCSPVMIIGGPSPEASALTRCLRAADVKVLHAPNQAIAAKSVEEDSSRVIVADMRSSRSVENAEDVLAEVRGSAEQTAVLFWFDAAGPDATGDDPATDDPAGDGPVADSAVKGRLAERMLRLGGPLDDFISGGVDVAEAALRLHVLSSRLPALREGERLVVGDLELDARRRTVTRAGVDIDLSATELKLLRLLMRHSRTVLSKSEILHEVWEYEFAGQANIVELYISYLRKKIEAGMPRMIHTVRGAGYVLRPAEEAQDNSVTEQ